MDSDIRSLIRSGHSIDAIKEAKRSNCVSDYEYPIQGVIKYIYQLYGCGKHIYGKDIDTLIINTASMIDANSITWVEIGCNIKNGVIQPPEKQYSSYGSRDWNLNMVPAIDIEGEILVIKESNTFSSVPTTIDPMEILRKVFVVSKRIKGHNNDALNKLNEKNSIEEEKQRNSAIKAKRQHRISIVKEALNISPELAEAYANKITDDAKFTRIANILIGKARAGK